MICEERFVEAMNNSNVDYLKYYLHLDNQECQELYSFNTTKIQLMDDNRINNIIVFITDIENMPILSLKLIDYLIENYYIKIVLITHMMNLYYTNNINNFHILEYILKSDTNVNDETIRECFGYLMDNYVGCVIESLPKYRTILELLIKYYGDHMNIDNIIIYPDSIYYEESDMQNYITYNIIDRLLEYNNNNIKIEKILTSVLKTAIPNDLVTKLLDLLPSNSSFHRQLYRDQFKIDKPLDYISLFNEDV